jgi:hypothetical protein
MIGPMFFRKSKKTVEWYDQTYEMTLEQLVTWLHTQFTGHHVESRIHDAGWAWYINTQPDAYLDGNQYAMTYGNGPWVVVKRDGAVFYLTSEPASLPLYNVPSEQEFYDLWASIRGYVPPPTTWVPR